MNFQTEEGLASYKEKVYYNSQVFKSLFGGSPSDFATKVIWPAGPNLEQMKFISDKYAVPLNYVKGINLADECINMQSAPQLQAYLNPSFGCTTVTKDNIIGQTLDLFDLELCIIRDHDSLYVTMPPYLCLLGMGPKLAMCTNHLFDKVDYLAGTPISQIRRQVLRFSTLDEAVHYLLNVKPTTAVNLMLTDGTATVNVELTPKGAIVFEAGPGKADSVFAHTNHVIKSFQDDKSCSRLNTARDLLLNFGKSVPEVLDAPGVVQPLANGFGTIVSVWIDMKEKILAYRDPQEKTYRQLRL